MSLLMFLLSYVPISQKFRCSLPPSSLITYQPHSSLSPESGHSLSIVLKPCRLALLFPLCRKRCASSKHEVSYHSMKVRWEFAAVTAVDQRAGDRSRDSGNLASSDGQSESSRGRSPYRSTTPRRPHRPASVSSFLSRSSSLDSVAWRYNDSGSSIVSSEPYSPRPRYTGRNLTRSRSHFNLFRYLRKSVSSLRRRRGSKWIWLS